MTLSSNSVPDITMVLGAAQATMSAWFQWQHGHQTQPEWTQVAAQTPGYGETQTQTWTPAAVWAQTSPWPWVVVQAIQINIALWQYGSPIPTWPQMGVQKLRICTAFSGNRNYWHLHRPWLYRATASDMILSNSLALTAPWPQVAV